MSNLINEEIKRIGELMGVNNKTTINEDRSDYINALKGLLRKSESELADSNKLRTSLVNALGNPAIARHVQDIVYDVTKNVVGEAFLKIEKDIFSNLTVKNMPIDAVNTRIDKLIDGLVAKGSIQGLTPEMQLALKNELKDRANKIKSGKTAKEVFGRDITPTKPKTSSTSSSTSKIISDELKTAADSLTSAIKNTEGFQKYLDKDTRMLLINQYRNQLTNPKNTVQLLNKARTEIDKLITQARKSKKEESAKKLENIKNGLSTFGSVAGNTLKKESLSKIFNKYTIIGTLVLLALFKPGALVEWFLGSKKEVGTSLKYSDYLDIPGWNELPKDAKDFWVTQMALPGTDITVSDILSFKINDKQDKIDVSLTQNDSLHMIKLPPGWKFN
jgi:hypothetical protein